MLRAFSIFLALASLLATTWPDLAHADDTSAAPEVSAPPAAEETSSAAAHPPKVVVRPNRRPGGWDAHPIILVARTPPDHDPVPVASEVSIGHMRQIARDPDEDPLTFRVLRKPEGARFAASNDVVMLDWRPSETDVGEHVIELDVSDGELTSRIRRTVIVVPEWSEDDYVGWLLPGGGPAAFLTHGDGELLLGGAFDVTLAAVRGESGDGLRCAAGRRKYDCHASHHRFYGQFEVLDSQRAGSPSIFTYGIGYSASFEWTPMRRYLIPHYGVEAGGLVRSGPGHLAQTRPYLGLHLWASDAIWIDAALGYRVVPADLYDLSGPTLALGVVLNPW